MGESRCIGACGPGLADCAENRVCDLDRQSGDGRCVREPEQGTIGEPCDGNADCGPGAVACLQSRDGLLCRHSCVVGADEACGNDEVCAPLNGLDPVGACLPAGPAPAMGQCAGSWECESGWCIEDYLDGRCGQPCTDDEDCGPGLCVDIARDPARPFSVCAPQCDTPSDCESPLDCRSGLSQRQACY
jgi:hypothetical protein